MLSLPVMSFIDLLEAQWMKFAHEICQICAITTVVQASIVIAFNHHDILLACFPVCKFALLQISLSKAVDVTFLECIFVLSSYYLSV